ncbi:MAG TPA: hypothetical protein DCE43_25205 [Planctomycetaceae bacterium]|nr:hypothetical protein [Planctomycetaceae bacterium]|tara:strand:+ start:240 stop:1436 length:1197 start_codon:yes stop_codon:yes gene_type:complete
MVIGLLAGCGGQVPNQHLTQARHHLQRAAPQQALQSLSGLTGTPDTHYLRGVALMQLDKLDAAHGEFQAATELSTQPRHRACLLKLHLFARDYSAAEKLISLELANPEDPVVRLSCVYAYEARAVRLSAESRHEASAAHRRRASNSLKTALALAGDIPEFHPELLDFAIEYGHVDPALSLVRLMRQHTPNDEHLERREIRLLMAKGDQAESIRLAHRVLLRHPDEAAAAVLYASTISSTPASKNHNSDFRRLRKRFPGNIALIALHARYLATNHRLTSACQVLATALASDSMNRLNNTDRWPLIQASITLPLQAGVPGLAEQQLNRYRGQIADELVVTYYEGQLLHLQQDYDAAQQKMTEVLKGRVGQGGKRDPLVTDAIRWLQRIRRAQGRHRSTAS